MNASPTNSQPVQVVQVQPLLVNGETAGRMCGISRRSWRRFDTAGKVPQAVRVGGQKMWLVSELVAWTEAKCPGRQMWEQLRKGAA